LLACSVPSSAQSEDNDPYSIRLVEGALKTAMSVPGVRISFVEKRLQKLGDAASVSVLKILDDRDFADRRTAEAVLQIIREAFSAPEMISLHVDRKPKVTLFLLGYLEQKTSDPSVRDHIRQTALVVTNSVGK
jgi:hypothetical protein